MNLPAIALRALLLATAPLAAMPLSAAAQDIAGSGVAPSAVENLPARPMQFVAEAPAGAVRAIVLTSADISPFAAMLPADAAARIARAEFTGKAGERLELPVAADAPRIVLFGARDEDAGTSPDWRVAGGRIAQEFASEEAPIAILGLPSGEAMAQAALGASLGQYRFDRYKSARKARPVQPLALVGAEADQARGAWERRYSALYEGVRFARDAVNEPASVVYPESFVARARALFAGVPDVAIRVIDQAEMRRLGMGALAGVGQGSSRPPRLMMITYRGAGSAPLALAGKGITFDSGGISLKPGEGMADMKADMAGAAAVTGAVYSLAKSRAPVHVVALAALAENMPGGNAQRPGDVVRTLSGKTIEIINTDAEGRLVLADAIEYAVQEAKPAAVVDIATLTGSAVAALGPEYAAVFARKDAHADAAIAAGAKVDEVLWRLPLHPAYRKAVESSAIADIKNLGGSAAPGASAGAHFIEHFVPQDMPWVHIDMAAVDSASADTPLVPAGARGFGVMLLDELARSWRP